MTRIAGLGGMAIVRPADLDGQDWRDGRLADHPDCLPRLIIVRQADLDGQDGRGGVGLPTIRDNPRG